MRRARLALLVAAVAGPLLAAPALASAAPAPPPPCPRYLSIADHTANEGTSLTGAPTRFTFRITSTGCASAGRTDYSTKYGTATQGDFTFAVGSLSFGVGDMSDRTITVDVAADRTAERNEGFTVHLCHPSSNQIQYSRRVGEALIVNDDEGPLVEPGLPPIEFRCSE